MRMKEINSGIPVVTVEVKLKDELRFMFLSLKNVNNGANAFRCIFRWGIS